MLVYSCVTRQESRVDKRANSTAHRAGAEHTRTEQRGPRERWNETKQRGRNAMETTVESDVVSLGRMGMWCHRQRSHDCTLHTMLCGDPCPLDSLNDSSAY